MDLQNDGESALYRHLTRVRAILPIAVTAVAATLEISEVFRPGQSESPLDLVVAVLIYAVVGPALIWLGLAWLARRIRQRDEAEARLRVLYGVGRTITDAPDLEALEKIALRLPEQILGTVATSLIVQDLPDGPWALAGTRYLSEDQRDVLEARAMRSNYGFLCDHCQVMQASQESHCPLLAALHHGPEPVPARAFCLPLSQDHPPRNLLNIYQIGAEELPAVARQMLESLTAALAVAMDRARLRNRDIQVLQRMEQAVAAQETQAGTLRHMLVDIGLAYEAEVSAVFQVTDESTAAMLTSVACWPGEEPALVLASTAQEVLQTDHPEVNTESAEIGHVIAIPLVTEGRFLGALALACHSPYIPSQLTLLRLAARVMAMVIRNGQLSTELENQAILAERHRVAREVHDSIAQSLGFLNFKVQEIERSLDRGESKAARQALREARMGIDELFVGVRVTLHELRAPTVNGMGLVAQMQEFITTFAARTGLAISFNTGGWLDLPAEAEGQLLRIVQEGLINVYRHAQARQVWVRLHRDPEVVTLEVQDDGRGLPDATLQQPPGGIGLRIIQERAQAIGGQSHIHSTPGQGVLLQVSVPVLA